MIKYKTIFAALGMLVCLMTLSTAAIAEKYQVDQAHSSLSFSVGHLSLTEIDGRFTDFSGTINWASEAPNQTTVEFTAQAKSVNTDVAQRDDHLRTADFFDVENYPTLSFKSRKVTHLGEDRYQVEGDLTIRGESKAVTTVARINGPIEAMGATKIGFRASFKINRLDFKIGDSPKFSSDALLSHDIFIEVKGEAAQATLPH